MLFRGVPQIPQGRRPHANRPVPPPDAAPPSQYGSYYANGYPQDLQRTAAQFSRGPSVSGGPATYASMEGQQSPRPVPATGRRVNTPSGPMSVQHDSAAITDRIDSSRNGVYSHFREIAPRARNAELGNGNRNRMFEGYYRQRDEPEPRAAYVENPSMHTTLSFHHLRAATGDAAYWNHLQSFPQGSQATDSGSFEKSVHRRLSTAHSQQILTSSSPAFSPATSFNFNDPSLGLDNIVGGSDAHLDSQQSPRYVPEEGSATVAANLDSGTGLCFWGDCSSVELYDRKTLWDHIKECHSPSSHDADRYFCHWTGCDNKNGFRHHKSLRRHIDDIHEFQPLWECQNCEGRWRRRDK